VPGSTTSRTSRSTCPATPSSSSPACPGPASRRSPSTRSSPRASAATSSRCRRTPASSSARWTSPTSTSSRACRPRSRSTRSRPTATRARPSAPSPRSTTTCGCSMPAPAPALPGLRRADRPGRPRSRSSTRSWLSRRARFQVLAPVVRGRKGEYVDLFAAADPGLLPGPGRRRGSTRSPTRPSSTSRRSTHRGRRRPARRQGESAKRASPTRSRPRCGLADGSSSIDFVDRPRPDPDVSAFSEKMACPNDHPLAIDDLEPRSFSFNAPSAPARECTGSAPGWRSTPISSCPTRPLSLAEGAIAPWSSAGHTSPTTSQALAGLASELGFDLNTPWGRPAAPRPRKAILEGHPTKVHVRQKQPLRARAKPTTPSSRASCPLRRAPHRRGRVRLQRASGSRATCARCRARPAPAAASSRSRWRSRCTTPARRASIAEVCALSINEAAEFLRTLDLSAARGGRSPNGAQGDPGAARFLLDVGLDYLTLDRVPRHAVRRRGAADPARHPDRIGPGRRALCARRAVSIGLHQRDNQRLIETLVRLRDLGNTLIVVEHDEDTIRWPPTGSSTSARAPASTAARWCTAAVSRICCRTLSR
jgi:excinuclease ABC subunit A